MSALHLSWADASGVKVIAAAPRLSASGAGEAGGGAVPTGGAAGQGAPASGREGGRAAGGGGGFETLLFPLLIVFVVVFLMIMPQRKKEKHRREMLGKLAKGDRVVTIGGVHGEVVQMGEHTIILLVDSQKGMTLKMARSAVARVLGDEAGEGEDSGKE